MNVRYVCYVFLGLIPVVLNFNCYNSYEVGHYTAGPSYSRHLTAGEPHQSELADGSVPSLDEEVWVIQRFVPADQQHAQPNDDAPGTGSMLARGVEEKDVAIPLKHTDVRSSLQGSLAAVDVTQQYHNPYDSKIEAVYVFPLPENAAIQGFVMKVGERRIRGIIREREEAKRVYNEAKSQGYVASLLTQERANIFTQSVANIEPGKQIDVSITYFHTLQYDDGWYEWVFPMVVGPRFNPPHTTDGVGALPRGSQDKTQATNVTYLRPNERSGHDISVHVEIDAGTPVEEVTCRSHVIKTDHPSSAKTVVTLAPSDTIPNKDFVLRYKMAGDAIKSGLVTHKDERGGYFMLTLYPPDDVSKLERQPVEMIFVLDCSGSMNGAPIAQAKAAIQRGLRSLQPDDTFQVVRFSDSASQFGSSPVMADAANTKRAIKYVKEIKGGGGTMMIEGIRKALDFPHDPERLRFVVFLTDGYIGNEAEILNVMDEHLADSRVFSFGVGSSPNRYLMDRMAKLGRGVVAYLGLNDSASDVMDNFFKRISRPAMTDLALDWGDAHVSELYPSRIPDLFVGRPVTIKGRYQGELTQPIRATGILGDQRNSWVIPTDTEEASSNHPALAAVWARSRIAHLMDHQVVANESNTPMLVREVALEYSLLSAYTAFVTVDASRQTEGTQGTTVAVPVPVPEGVKYETTVGQ